MTDATFVLGAGMTGLAAGLASGHPVLERETRVGGLCATYEVDGYRFERGGGHWLFGVDATLRTLFEGFCQLKSYQRRSAVLFTGALPCTEALGGRFVEYPIQDNLWALPEDLRRRVSAELLGRGRRSGTHATLADWLTDTFGPTLHDVFFEPFHRRYTAGLHDRIAPQDAYKSPVDHARVARGLEGRQADTGYNAEFLYPVQGLAHLADGLASRTTVKRSTIVERIEPASRVIQTSAGCFRYERLVSTLPLHALAEACGWTAALPAADPYTSVLVVNLGVKTPDTPAARHGYHWLYVPDSRSGLHRIGYYSNVDPSFLPAEHRSSPGYGSLYVEVAYPGGARPSESDARAKVAAIVAELAALGLVEQVEVADATWIDVAYTWTCSGSRWVAEATACCEAAGIATAGRYGRWRFQGIAESVREGLAAGTPHRSA